MTESECNHEAWQFENTVSFYSNERNSVKDLYDSERNIVIDTASEVTSVLDVGCAVGGFSSIFHELNANIKYTGVDVAPKMVAKAKENHPGSNFYITDGINLDFHNDSFDLVICTGILIHQPRFLELIKEMVRVSKKYIIVDLPRLVKVHYNFSIETSYQLLNERFPLKSKGLSDQVSQRVCYVLSNFNDAFHGLFNITKNKLTEFSAHGYWGEPSKSVYIPISPILFCVVLLVKGSTNLKLSYDLNLPPDVYNQMLSILNYHHKI
tara:strand:+ start:853 stop:1650 length:798 start_codon:yes stop_codon:yes gene_type:complete